MIRLRRAYLPAITASLAVVLLVTAVLFGGASRLDVLPPIVARLAGLATIAWLLWAAVPQAAPSDRMARLIWFGLFLIPLFQLIPLPWSVWIHLPGRELVRDVDAALELTPWHGISLTPDRTLKGMLALIPAFAAWLAGRRLDETGRERLLHALAALALASAVLGLAQRAGGPSSRLYFYAITNADSSVGLFSNANHHALFLCCGIVAVLFWLSGRARAARALPTTPALVALLSIAVMGGSILATSSRAGVIIAPVALLAGLAMLPWRRLGIGPVTLRSGAIAVVASGALAVVLVLSGTFGEFGVSNSISEDGRIGNLSLFARIIGDQFPFGAGLGSFDPLFRGYEQTATLSLSYLNNAHNDYAQIMIEAGLAGMLLLALFGLWWSRRTFAILRAGLPQRADERLAWAGSAITGSLLVHSLVDYPLRTAALSVVFGFCCAFISLPVAEPGQDQ